MNLTSRRRYESLVRVHALCSEHRDVFTATPLGTKMLAQLDTSVTNVADHFASQSKGRNAAQTGAAARVRSRKALRNSLKAVVRSSRFVGLASDVVAEEFPLPEVSSDQQLVADATAILEKATPLADAFAASGLPANVLKDLPAQISAVNGAIVAQAAGRETHVGARAAVKDALVAGLQAADALESIFLTAPNMDANAVAMWKHARRIGPARMKEDPTAATPPATAASVKPEQPAPQSAPVIKAA